MIGDERSDDPFCRDLCLRSGVAVVSVDYRHGPEHRFPAAIEDGLAAVGWVAEHADELGATPGRLVVAGWSAGATVATVVCRLARDAGGPVLTGQLLAMPLTDCDLSRPSYGDRDSGTGYGLTTELMRWFWDNYADPPDRTDPMASPLRADDLAGLPPTLVVTAEFDPLRDEGAAYADALAAAGVPVRHLRAHGHTHASVFMVDVVLSGAAVRAEMAGALRGFFSNQPVGLRADG